MTAEQPLPLLRRTLFVLLLALLLSFEPATNSASARAERAVVVYVLPSRQRLRVRTLRGRHRAATRHRVIPTTVCHQG